MLARAESLGWFDESDRLVEARLVQPKPLPMGKRVLAYLPEGPVIDWAAPDLERSLELMLVYPEVPLKSRCVRTARRRRGARTG
ncbi:hypothetical protein AB0D23_43435 [Streptomyces umbrinus]